MDDKVDQNISHKPHKCDASLHAQFDNALLLIFSSQMSCCTCCTYAKYHGRASAFKLSFTTRLAHTFGAEMVLRSMFLRFPLLLVPHVLYLFSISPEERGEVWEGLIFANRPNQNCIILTQYNSPKCKKLNHYFYVSYSFKTISYCFAICFLKN